jgi:5,6,7,8-tetrahydromethanopterin hydro-lyase
MTSNDFFIGEGFVGDGVNAAHINTVMGLRSGPVGTAWATALATPRVGHVPFVAVASPGTPVLPFTLFVNKATIETEMHGTLTWGAAQAGVAAGVGQAHLDGHIPPGSESQVLIAAVWVNPSANDEEAVFTNNRAAMLLALAMARSGAPDTGRAIAAMIDPSNPYFRQP